MVLSRVVWCSMAFAVCDVCARCGGSLVCWLGVRVRACSVQLLLCVWCDDGAGDGDGAGSGVFVVCCLRLLLSVYVWLSRLVCG